MGCHILQTIRLWTATCTSVAKIIVIFIREVLCYTLELYELISEGYDETFQLSDPIETEYSSVINVRYSHNVSLKTDLFERIRLSGNATDTNY